MSAEREIATLDQAQRVEELPAKSLAAPAVVGERGDGAERLVFAQIGAEVGLQSPERDDHRRRHAELLLDARECCGIGLDQLLAALNAITGGHAAGEFEKRLGEDALAAIDIDDLLIVGEARRNRGDGACEIPCATASRSKAASQAS